MRKLWEKRWAAKDYGTQLHVNLWLTFMVFVLHTGHTNIPSCPLFVDRLPFKTKPGFCAENTGKMEWTLWPSFHHFWPAFRLSVVRPRKTCKAKNKPGYGNRLACWDLWSPELREPKIRFTSFNRFPSHLVTATQTSLRYLTDFASLSLG